MFFRSIESASTDSVSQAHAHDVALNRRQYLSGDFQIFWAVLHSEELLQVERSWVGFAGL
jgi:hypothetical protein